MIDLYVCFYLKESENAQCCILQKMISLPPIFRRTLEKIGFYLFYRQKTPFVLC